MECTAVSINTVADGCGGHRASVFPLQDLVARLCENRFLTDVSMLTDLTADDMIGPLLVDTAQGALS